MGFIVNLSATISIKQMNKCYDQIKIGNAKMQFLNYTLDQ